MIESDAPGSVIADSLTAVEDAVGALRAASARLDSAEPAAVTAMMGRLTTLAGQLDGLRVQVARQVGDRQLYRAAGARNLAGWLRGDPRTADQAWAIARLAGAGLPKVTALLADGAASLAQAGAASWQIARLPDLARPAPQAPGNPADDSPDGDSPDGSAPDGDGGGPHDGPDGAGPDDDGGDRWAGLWQAGDVHAAADELFAGFLPGLDAAGVRQLGAHLQEAADVSGHAGQERSDYERRRLRISGSLHGTGEISGRLHAEAAAVVIAAFDELGARSGPGDTRTKAQRWADALVRLITLPAGQPAPGQPGDGQPGDGRPEEAGPWDAGTGDGERDDDQPCHGDGHDHDGHDHPHDGHPRGGHARPAGPGTATGPGPVPAGLRRPRIIVTIPLATLLRQPLAPGAVIGAATPISGEAARRLACDAEIIRLITSPAAAGPAPAGSTSGLTAGEHLALRLNQAIASLPPPLGTPSAALDIGRKSPGWTPRQRDALHAQYGGRCAFPGGCTNPIDVIHHIRHWADGGPTTISNGWPGCHYHHWLVHEGGWRILKHPDSHITAIPPPPGWQPGTIYRSGKPIREHPPHPG